MRADDLTGTAWHKSSRSVGGSDQTDCVEITDLPDRIAMRDSKDPAGPVLAFTRRQWRAFLYSVQTGQLG